ncbi:MAG TPA: hypothetical protein VD735_00020 [Candidatus Saccharimonadales bacterium]|nr:hypothetical protein [Candidatus Saccharimonadales bacterium]
MNRLDQRGAINILLVPLILVVVLFVGALGFGFWAFAGYQDYKTNSDKKAQVAANEAILDTQEADAKKFAEEAKKPYDTFIGAAAFGNVTVNYPKTWSAYVEEKDSGSKPINAYFQPKIVPTVSNIENSFALRVELVQQSYDNVVESYGDLLKSGKVTISPFKLDKVPSVVGSRIEGQITVKKQGSMIILPLRNMTLKIWTESNDFKPDLDTHILPNLTFVP